MLVEKRKAHRVSTSFPVYYRSAVTSIQGSAINVSRTGLFLRTDYLDEPNVQVELELTLPNGKIVAKGTVARTDSSPSRCGMGINFDQMSDDCRRVLANFASLRAYQQLH